MSELTESAVDRISTSLVTTADTTSTTKDIETGHQSESETTNRSAVDSTEPAERRGLPLDETFELLRNQRRRYVLQYLEEAEGKVTLSELAEQIAAWENDKEVRLINSSERKRVYVALYQCHLPKMHGMDVISFNKPRGTIEKGKHGHAVEPYLQRAATPQRPSLNGRVVGSPIVGVTGFPVVVLLLSQSTIALGVAVFVALVATVWAVAALRGGGSGNEANPAEHTTA